MNSGHRAVTSIALGASLAIVAWAVTAELNVPAGGGWFMYSPESTGLSVESSGGSVLVTAGIWLAAVAVWFAVSWRLFRSDE